MAVEKVIKIDLTITQSKIKIKDLEKQVKSLDGRTLKYRQALQKLRLEEQKLQSIQKQRATNGKTLVKSNENLAKSTKKVYDSSGLANTAVQELGRGASDSAFGIQGMANNASQLGSLFGTLVQKTGGFTNALKAMGAAMLGPLGIVVLFQALTAVIQTNWFNALLAGGQAQKDLNDTMKEGAKIAGENVTEFKILTDILLDKKASDEDQARAVRVLNKDFKEFNTELITNAENYDEAKKSVDAFTSSLIAQAKAEAALTLIKEKQGQILLLEEERQKKIRETGAKDEADLDRVIIEQEKSLQSALRKVRESGVDAGSSRFGLSPEKQKELLKKRFDNIKDFNKEEIAELEESIKVLSNLGDIKALILSGGDEKDPKGKAEENEQKRQEKILAIQEQFRRKQEDLEDTLQIDKVERQLERDLLELEALGATEEQKLEIRTYYNGLIRDARAELFDEYEANLQAEEDEETAKENRRLKRINDNIIKERGFREIAEDSKQKAITRTSNLLISLGGVGAKIGKAIAVANITRNGIEAVQNAFTTASASPISILNPSYPFTQAISAGAFSAAQLARVLSTGGGSSSSSAASSTQSAPSFNAPSFSLVEGTGSNQIANSISTQSPVQAFVVGSTVTTAQQLERNKITESSI